MPYLIGYRFLQIGGWAYNAGTLDRDHARRAWIASGSSESVGDLFFDGHNLPVASRSLDAVIMPHALECCARPQQLLREVDRVLCARGQLVLLGFNPLHPVVPARRLALIGGGHPGVDHLYTARRVGDWLELLDFEVVHSRRYGVGFPYLPRDGVEWHRAGRWRLPAALAGAYLLVARKRVVPATTIRPFRKSRRRVTKRGVPAASRMHSLFRRQHDKDSSYPYRRGLPR